MTKKNRNAQHPEETKKPVVTRRRALIFVGVALGFLVIISMIPSNEDSSSNGDNTDQSADADVTSPAEAVTPVGRLTDAIRDETGKSNIEGYGDRIQLVEFSEEQTLIRLLGSENITSGLTKSSNRRLVLETIKAYQSAGLTSQFIAIDVYYPLVDNLGTEKLYRILGYGFTQDRIMAITADNIDTERMDENFADEFTFVHPEFQW